jgi:hypothetical protein
MFLARVVKDFGQSSFSREKNSFVGRIGGDMAVAKPFDPMTKSYGSVTKSYDAVSKSYDAVTKSYDSMTGAGNLQGNLNSLSSMI